MPKIQDFLVMTPSRLICDYLRFRGPCCLHHQLLYPRRLGLWRLRVCLHLRYSSLLAVRIFVLNHALQEAAYLDSCSLW